MKLTKIMTVLAFAIGPVTVAHAVGAQRSTLVPAMTHVLLVDSDSDDDSEQSDGRSDDDCGDDDEQGGSADCGTTGANNAAPAGTTAPPKNGLFGNGKAPQVKTN